MKIFFIFTFACFLNFGINPLFAKNSQSSFSTAEQFVRAARDQMYASQNSTRPQPKVKHAKRGQEIAKMCLQKFSKEVGCYYYRALNTGLYYEATGFGYQNGLKQMVKDAYEMIRLNKNYEGGGAYRLLGFIYLKVPGFSLKKNAITQDVEKAYKFALTANELAPDDVDNQSLLAQVYFEKEEYDKAYNLLKKVIELYPKKQPYTWYDKSEYENLKRLQAKAQKRLTK